MKMTRRPSSVRPLSSPVLFWVLLNTCTSLFFSGKKVAQPVFQSCCKYWKQYLHSPESSRCPGHILLDYYVQSIEKKVVGSWGQRCCFANPSLHLSACLAAIGPGGRKHGFQHLERHTSKCPVSDYIAAMYVQNMSESISENL